MAVCMFLLDHFPFVYSHPTLVTHIRGSEVNILVPKFM
jgi:hypothetical protein